MSNELTIEIANLPCAAPNIGDCGHCVTCEARKYVEEFIRIPSVAADAG